MKLCTKCNKPKPYSDFDKSPKGANGLRSQCKQCRSEERKEYAKTPNGIRLRKLHSRNRHISGKGRAQAIKRIFGIEADEYYSKVSSATNCEICGVLFQVGLKYGSGLSKVLDHDHKTGNVRGVICKKCNNALGFFDDNIDTLYSAIDYLSKHQTY